MKKCNHLWALLEKRTIDKPYNKLGKKNQSCYCFYCQKCLETEIFASIKELFNYKIENPTKDPDYIKAEMEIADLENCETLTLNKQKNEKPTTNK